MGTIELVEIENLSYWYPEREEPSLSDVSVSLSEGELVVLAGASGCGKSTLCRSVNGLVPHFYGGRISGSVSVAGMDASSVRVRDLARVVGMVFQDPENQLVSESPVAEIAFGLENIGLDAQQMRKRVEEVIASLRLGDLRRKRTRELSGGQKQKVVLASVLAMHPRVLVLDEPTSQLDPISADDFLSTLKSLNDELGLAVLLAEHRVERCYHFADRVVVLEEGRLVFDGAPAEITRWARGARSFLLPPIARLFMNGEAAPVPLTVKAGRMKVAELAAGSGGPFDSAPRPIEPGDARAGTAREAEPKRSRRSRSSKEPAPIIETRGLWHVYDDGTEALRGVDVSIQPGEFVAVIGENGSGKTTLVRHFNGLLRPSKGKVMLAGRDTGGMEVYEMARTCGMLGQNPNSQLIAESSMKELETTLEAMGVPREDWASRIHDVVELLDLAGVLDRDPEDLSCGERERVALGSVLVYRPEVLLLDEPTRGIDQSTKERLGGHLRAFNAQGRTVVLVTHDLEFAAESCTRVLLMGAGTVLADGDKHQVLSESLFFTTQYSKCFRGVAGGVVTREEARGALEAMSWESRSPEAVS